MDRQLLVRRVPDASMRPRPKDAEMSPASRQCGPSPGFNEAAPQGRGDLAFYAAPESWVRGLQ